MHGPSCVAHEIKSPFRSAPSKMWPKGHRNSLVTIWHVDPECDGADDSCGWFIRGRHLKAADKALADRLVTNEFDNLKMWLTGRDDEEKISQVAGIFAALCRQDRPWWKHPKWHFWHWRFQIHPWQQFRRWMLTRCAGCGKSFAYGESPTSHQWHSPKPKFLRGEEGMYHGKCSGMTVALHKATPEGTA